VGERAWLQLFDSRINQIYLKNAKLKECFKLRVLGLFEALSVCVSCGLYEITPQRLFYDAYFYAYEKAQMSKK
jgi:hypothetical protein